jgi:AcrR family transcriptional regulator
MILMTLNSISATLPNRRRAGRPARHGRTPNKHQQKTEETRQALLESARTVFARDGFQACRIEDIAADAGYTRGAFYANFDSKEELFFTLLQAEANQRSTEIHQVLSGCTTIQDRWAALRSYYLSGLADKTWGMLMLEFKIFAVRQPRLRSRLAATHRRIRASMNLDSIEALLGVSKKFHEPRRAVLEAVLAGLFLQHSYDPELLSLEQAEHYLGAIFDFLVQPPTAT